MTKLPCHSTLIIWVFSITTTLNCHAQWDTTIVMNTKLDSSGYDAAVCALGSDRYCVAEWSFNVTYGEDISFTYLNTNSGTVSGIAVQKSGQALTGMQDAISWWTGSPALTYLPVSDKICLVTPWLRNVWGGSYSVNSKIYGLAHSIDPDDIEDGYASNDRWSEVDSTIYWESNDPDLDTPASNMHAQVDSAVIESSDVVGAVLSYSNMRKRSGLGWQGGSCASQIFEHKLPFVAYGGSSLANLFDTGTYVLGSQGEDDSCNGPICCPSNSSSEDLLEFYWDTENFGGPYTVYDMKLKDGEPNTVFFEPLSENQTIDYWDGSTSTDAANPTSPLIAVGDTGSETVTWLPYWQVVGGVMKIHYKYREDNGSWSAYNTNVTGYPMAVDTKSDGSMVLIYVASPSYYTSVYCMVVPPGGGQTPSTNYVAQVRYLNYLHEFDVHDDQAVVLMDYWDDEEEEATFRIAYKSL